MLQGQRHGIFHDLRPEGTQHDALVQVGFRAELIQDANPDARHDQAAGRTGQRRVGTDARHDAASSSIAVSRMRSRLTVASAMRFCPCRVGGLDNADPRERMLWRHDADRRVPQCRRSRRSSGAGTSNCATPRSTRPVATACATAGEFIVCRETDRPGWLCRKVATTPGR